MRRTKVVSISLPSQDAKRLRNLARVSRRAQSEIVREAIQSYQLKDWPAYPSGAEAWNELEEIGRSLAPRIGKGALSKALQQDRG